MSPPSVLTAPGDGDGDGAVSQTNQRLTREGLQERSWEHPFTPPDTQHAAHV